MKRSLIASALTAAVLVGCGGGGSPEKSIEEVLEPSWDIPSAVVELVEGTAGKVPGLSWENLPSTAKVSFDLPSGGWAFSVDGDSVSYVIDEQFGAPELVAEFRITNLGGVLVQSVIPIVISREGESLEEDVERLIALGSLPSERAIQIREMLLAALELQGKLDKEAVISERVSWPGVDASAGSQALVRLSEELGRFSRSEISERQMEESLNVAFEALRLEAYAQDDKLNSLASMLSGVDLAKLKGHLSYREDTGKFVRYEGASNYGQLNAGGFTFKEEYEYLGDLVTTEGFVNE